MKKQPTKSKLAGTIVQAVSNSLENPSALDNGPKLLSMNLSAVSRLDSPKQIGYLEIRCPQYSWPDIGN